ncbi:RNA polymerase sigma factor [Thiospirochaeta perfilievii]|uniref:RNA polymerase sigma factor n=1 Tax=Thiospirochaeta perfilievii TaxID=252967 RepID=A0A5C1Q9G0_9SPIO|nr:RNA polymerase sigma factor [Thiospirochaeta perfilievii]QEN03529.1 RNA polymerase sigma factor [Thiospirochaeta perfilievii]
MKEMIKKDKEVFNWLVTNYYSRVYKTSLFYLKNRDDALDITQDVFIKAFDKIDFSKTSNSKFPILFIIAKNLSLNRLKSRGYKCEGLVDYDLKSKIKTPEEDYIEFELKKEIQEYLNKLPPKDREILILKHFRDCSYSEISEILGIPIGTVMSRLYSARKKMGEYLKGEYNG